MLTGLAGATAVRNWRRIMAEYILGLDLGPTADPSALAVLERSPALGAELPSHIRHRLDVVHLRRWPPGTPYLSIGADVAGLMERPELHPRHRPPRWLVVDATGVGRPVVDLLLARPLPAPTLVHPVTITAGSAVRGDWWPVGRVEGFRVPRRDLVSHVQAGLQAGALKVVPGLPLAGLLKKELMNF